jgi:hypothetical protein
MITKHITKFLAALVVSFGFAGALTSCSDEPDSEYFYTFTGEMMSDYLKNRSEYSSFTKIVERANLMDLLATYGHYTCFVPADTAVQTFLRKRGLNSIDELSDADCDTIARTHLVSNMYTTYDMMVADRLPTSNMMGRYLATASDEVDGHPVVRIEGLPYVYFETQNDSVENGIVQPVSEVIEKSNSYIADVLRSNESITIFYEALVATGVREEILGVEDPEWDPKAHEKKYYRSHTWNEVAWVPDTKKYGYTMFIEPNSVYLDKFQELGISTANGNLRALYDLACSIYDEVYPDDKNAEGHSFENLTDSVNPLHRFIQYHILNHYVAGTADLTPMIMNIGDVKNEAFGFHSKLINPNDWHKTLLPHTMIKVEQLTMEKDEKGNDCQGADVNLVNERFINRRYEGGLQIRGALIDSRVETTPVHDALNGHYFYVDDIVAFSKEVRDVVQNIRIRMDFSTVFPEVLTNGLRYEGNPLADDDAGTPDDAAVPKNGRNYYFPMGYLDGVTFDESNMKFVLRRPHTNFWSWQGDEWNLFGDYDITFRIPPVPYTGEWQLRLGFCAIETRGVMQVYFDGVPQGIPLDMTKFLNSELYIGSSWGADEFDEKLTNYNKKTVEEKAEEQKLLKNLGAYRGGRSMYHFSPTNGDKNTFCGNPRTYRRILCQTTIDANSDHYIRFRVASDGKQGNDNEFMLDYFEMVPKSVYSVDGDGDMEDDL